MKTLFLLGAQYDGQPLIPLEIVLMDFFGGLTQPHFLKMINNGDINLPITRMTVNHKSKKYVHIEDLATWIDERRAAAQKEANQLKKVA
jgi:hypothetical protein